MSTAPNLLKFQQDFGYYLRKQTHDDSDDKMVPERVGRLYQELILNSVVTFPKQCFPICRAILGDKFDDLCQEFFANYSLHSPYFAEINHDFVGFLEQKIEQQTRQKSKRQTNKSDDYLPKYLDQLAHYEWVELAVDILPNSSLKPLFYIDDLALTINPTIENLAYEFAVHEADEDSTDVQEIETFLVVYRGLDDGVHSTQINALTHLLVDFMLLCEIEFSNFYQLLETFLPSVGMQLDQTIMDFADELVQDLLQKEILLKMPNLLD